MFWKSVQLAGIQFNLIVIRVGRGIATEHLDTQTKQHETEHSLHVPGNSTSLDHTSTFQTAIAREDTDLMVGPHLNPCSNEGDMAGDSEQSAKAIHPVHV